MYLKGLNLQTSKSHSTEFHKFLIELQTQIAGYPPTQLPQSIQQIKLNHRHKVSIMYQALKHLGQVIPAPLICNAHSAPVT